MGFLPDGMPRPKPTIDDAPFWEAANRHELVVQHCLKCGTFRHSPMPCCYKCQSFEYEWKKIEGKGVIFSYINVDHPVHPALKDRVPFNAVIVELPEAGNVRMVGNVIDTPFDELYIGMPVEVTFEDIDEQTALPRWKRAQG